jgi:hypothetical protein
MTVIAVSFIFSVIGVRQTFRGNVNRAAMRRARYFPAVLLAQLDDGNAVVIGLLLLL